MRLPCDAVLIVIDARSAIDDPQWGARDNPGAEAAIAALLAAWRTETLPVIHIRHDSIAPNSPDAPGKSGRRFKPDGEPRPSERVVAKRTLSAFVDTALEEELDALGATTLVLCGALTAKSLEATARHAGDLGYRVFVVADACRAVDQLDLRGRLRPPGDADALSLGRLSGEYAEIVDCAQTLKAAAMANIRARRRGPAAR